MKRILKIKGLDCAGCAAKLEQKLSKITGVNAVSVSFVSQKIIVDFVAEETLDKIIDTINTFESVKVINDGDRVETNGKKHAKQWLRIACSAILLLCGIFIENFASGVSASIIQYVFYVFAYITGNTKFFRRN